ncbi:MAG: hypothetical protein K6F32_06090 [Bacilli bacterium]|nr:hypothetical protein [Bacilli bacterium]
MSNNKKNQKKRKKPNLERRAKIFAGLRTLISNQAVVEGGRSFKWYFPVIMAFVAIILAVIPTFASNMSIQAGNSFFATTYGYEVGLLHFEQALDAGDVSLVIQDGALVNTTNNWQEKMGGTKKWYQYKATDLYGNGEETVAFEVFYNDSDIADADFLTSITKNKNPYVTDTDEYRSNDANGNPLTTVTTPFLLLGKKMFYAASFKANGASATAVSGLYDHHNGLDLKTLYTKDINGNTLTGDAATGRGLTQSILASWKTFVTDGYNSTKVRNTWMWTGIIIGVNAGTVLLMGLLIFLLTRGKRNPFHIFTFWETMKMSMLASFSPAVIAIPVGFLMSQFAYFGFVIIFAFRVMWMSMRTLSPSAQQ